MAAKRSPVCVGREIVMRWLQLSDDADYLDHLIRTAPPGAVHPEEREIVLDVLNQMLNALVGERPTLPPSPLRRRSDPARRDGRTGQRATPSCGEKGGA